jgi:choline oxidase
MTAPYDYVVVGGGTAGAIVAARLAEDPAIHVALLEAGPNDEGLDFVLELRNWPNLLRSELDYDYVIEIQPRGNSLIRHSRARVLGGCSSHNSCIAFRGPDSDFVEWEARGARGWGPAGVARYFDRVWTRVHVEEPPECNPLNGAVIEAARQAGFPLVRFNQGEFREGVGRFQLNARDGIRQSSSVAYLHPLAKHSSNLDILTDTVVSRIVLDEHMRATGVETNRGLIETTREVIVCCGAFDSPRLLLLSGIGPAAHLRDVGVPVRVDLPGVGENLLDHPEGVVIWESTRPVPPESSQFWEVGLFARTTVEEQWPDLMLHFGLMPFDMNTLPLGYPTAENGFSLTPNVCRARSQGTVRLRSACHTDAPRIDFRYFTDPEGYDERVILAGVKLARRIAEQPALKPWIKCELAPGKEVQSDEELSEYARRSANTVYHPAGTCRMGAVEDPGAVVGPDLRVIGVRGLRVADASIFPTMLSVNPAMTCMMIGEKCTDLIRNGE